MRDRIWRNAPPAGWKEKEARLWISRREALSRQRNREEYRLCHK